MKTLKIIIKCENCEGNNEGSTNVCPICFGKGEKELYLYNVISYEED